MKKYFVLILLFSHSFFTDLNAQPFGVDFQLFVYKEVDSIGLTMEVYRPITVVQKKLPAIVFFFGGGWVSGK